jgi:hypothetical protein
MVHDTPRMSMDPPLRVSLKRMQLPGDVMEPQSRFLTTRTRSKFAAVKSSSVAVPPSMVNVQKASRLNVEEPKASLVSVPGQPV